MDDSGPMPMLRAASRRSALVARQLQVWPQTVCTSATHCASQALLQQYGSTAQIWPAHASHAGWSIAPAVHVECAHEGAHDSPATVWTSVTQ
jgi:hypothetical protein